MKSAIIYARISSDATHEQAGVDRQLADCRALAERRGWTIVAEFADNDISAYSGKKRPGYLAMLDALKNGEANALICWHPDRLTRNPRELEDVLDVVEMTEIEVVTCQAGDINLSTPSGRAVARTLVAWGKHESEHKGARQRRAFQDMAKAGKRHGFIPYGWRSEVEGAVVAEIVTRLLAGTSLRTIGQDLNARAIPAPRGGQWTSTQVRQIALRASNAGLRTHQGVVVAEAAWPRLVSRQQWERVTRLLKNPERRSNPQVSQVHLLSGLARCGKCGGPMQRVKVDDRRRPAYRCRERLDVTIRANDLEDFVLRVVQARLEAPDAAAVVSPSDDAHDELRGRLEVLRGRLDALAEDYVAGVLDREQTKVAGDFLREQIAVVEVEMRGLESKDAALAARGVDVFALNVEGQRALIKGLFTITVLPATKRGRAAQAFDSGRVQISWR